jgi:peroxiredoxin
VKPVIGLLGLAAFAAFSAEVKHEVIRNGESAAIAALPVGHTVPDFTLSDRAGTGLTLSKVAANEKLVLVNFWGAWCGPCRLEMPGFEKMYTDTANKGLQILAVDEEDTPEELETYLKKRPLSFPVLRDSGGVIAKRFGIRAFPTTVLVGHDGRILRVIEGVEPYLNVEVSATLGAHHGKDSVAFQVQRTAPP